MYKKHGLGKKVLYAFLESTCVEELLFLVIEVGVVAPTRETLALPGEAGQPFLSNLGLF